MPIRVCWLAVTLFVLYALVTVDGIRTKHEALSKAFIEMMVKGTIDAPPRCGRDFGGKKCSDKDVGRPGWCCSSLGLCGTKPFDCVTLLGCQSECNDDLLPNFGNATEETPTSVTLNPLEQTAPQIIIKTLITAIPLTPDCPKCEKKPAPSPAAPKTLAGTPASLENVVRAATMKALGAPNVIPNKTPSGAPASGVPIPPAAQTSPVATRNGLPLDDHSAGATATPDPDSGTLGQVDSLKKAVEELKLMKVEAERKARAILQKAKALAKKMHHGKAPRQIQMRTVYVKDFAPTRQAKASIIDNGEEQDHSSPLDPVGY